MDNSKAALLARIQDLEAEVRHHHATPGTDHENCALAPIHDALPMLSNCGRSLARAAAERLRELEEHVDVLRATVKHLGEHDIESVPAAGCEFCKREHAERERMLETLRQIRDADRPLSQNRATDIRMILFSRHPDLITETIGS